MKACKILVCLNLCIIPSVYAQSSFDNQTKQINVDIGSVLINDQANVKNKEKVTLDDRIAVDAIHKAQQYLRMKQPQYAIQATQSAIAYFENYQKSVNEVIYAANDQAETLMYLAFAANQNKNSRVVSGSWSYLYFIQAYALSDLNDSTQALVELRKAMILSPYNSEYHREVGFILQMQKQWQASFESFKTAEQYLSLIETESKKAQIQQSLQRGLGVNLIELGRLDEAEVYFHQVLLVNPSDNKAKDELLYIKNLRNKGAESPVVPVQ